MKKTIYSLFLVIFVFSCTEDVITTTLNDDSIFTLNFEDSDEMINYFNSTINEGDNIFQRTSTKVNSEFKSFKEVYHTALDELDEVETDEEHQSFLNKYSDIISLEDSVYVPKITNPFYQAICNRDGIYEADGFAHKVIDSKNMIVTESANIKALQNINSTSGLDSEIFSVIPYNKEEGSENEQGRGMANCGSTVQKDYFNNNRRCRDDRMVVVRGHTSFIIAGGYNFTPQVIAEAFGLIRNGWCNWKEYRTELKTRDCSFRVTASMNEQFYSSDLVFPDKAPTQDVYNIVLYQGSLTNYPIYWQGGSYPTIQFTQVNLEATSRGVNGPWVELNCQ